MGQKDAAGEARRRETAWHRANQRVATEPRFWGSASPDNYGNAIGATFEDDEAQQ